MTTQDTTSPAYHYGQRIKLKVKPYPVLRQAVEEGVQYGYGRAFKYVDTPTPDHVVSTIVENVMNSCCEMIDFGDEV